MGGLVPRGKGQQGPPRSDGNKPLSQPRKPAFQLCHCGLRTDIHEENQSSINPLFVTGKASSYVVARVIPSDDLVSHVESQPEINDSVT